ncbi:hypothetical protein [Fodinicola acaciae]|uniref:hypothetical protein n=1 Tax=Fodinicola acaciae TaxID=2681555 RepID=UPI0013D7BC25|nr:hypothetical protein [Fodinicola acaciae]
MTTGGMPPYGQQPNRGPAPGYPPAGYPAQPPTGPVTGAPTSGYPVTGAPVSGYPVSGYPVSGYPVSGHPASAPPGQPKPDMRQMRQTSRSAGVATVLSVLNVVLTLLLLYTFPFFSDRDLTITSVAGIAGATSIMAVAVTALVAARLRQLPLPVAVVLVSFATGLVPAVISGGVVIFHDDAVHGIAVMLTVLVSSVLCGLFVLIRPARTLIAAAMTAAVVALVIRFVNTLISQVVLHWLIWSLGWQDSALIAFAVIFNSSEEIVLTAIVVAAIVPGLIRTGMVSGHEIRAGVLVGVIPGLIRFVSAGLSCIPLLIFRTEGGKPIDIFFTGFAFSMYGLIGAFTGLLVGILVAAISRPKRA